MPFLDVNTLAYPATNSFPGPRWKDTRDPTSSDFKNFSISTMWINTTNQTAWIMVDKTATSGTWIQAATVSTGILTVTGDAGGAVAADGANNINLLTGPGLTTTGNPGTNTVTITLDGGGQAVDQINVDASTPPGTDPVLPTATGQITITGAQVAAGGVGANVIRTDSLAANTFTIEIQRSTAVVASDPVNNGVSHFNSAQFSVNADGFVSLAGAGLAIDSIGVDAATAPGTNPVVPTAAGLVTVTGAQVASGTIGANVIRTDSLAANTYTIEIQRSGSAAAQNTTLNGVAHFNSAQFTVTNGFVELTGGGAAIDSFIPDAGVSPVVPNASGQVTMVGGNGILTTGGVNTLTFDMQSPFTGDFTFTDSTAGDTETLTCSNTDNTGASASSAAVVASVGGTTQIGDPYFLAAVGAARSYSLGPDTSASQTLKINTAAAASVTPSSGTNLWSMTSAGERTMPLQPAFLAYLDPTVSNVTGDGTVYTIIFNTEVFDQNSDYNPATGTFTAPVTGRYDLKATAELLEFVAPHTTAVLDLVTSNRGYEFSVFGPGAATTGAPESACFGNSVLADMDAADTATVTMQASGGAASVDISGPAPGPRTHFSGYLAC